MNNDDNLKVYLSLIQIILKIYPPLMLVIGTIGNLVSFLVLMYGSRKKSTTFSYLACLALIDSSVLLTFCINFIYLYHFNVDLQDKSQFFCKLFAFLVYFLPQYSAWTLSVVSVDRMLALSFYSSYKNSSKQKRQQQQQQQQRISLKETTIASTLSETKQAFLIVLSIGILLALLNLHFFYLNTGEYQSPKVHVNLSLFNLSSVEQSILVDGINVIKCSSEHNPLFQDFYKIWVHLDSVMNVYLPFMIMTISSIIIIKCIVASMKAAGNYRRHKITRSVSLMLVSLNVMFIALTSPIVILLTIDASLPPSQTNLLSIVKRRLLKLICIIIMNSNHALNIMVYCLIGKEFRRHFCCVLRKVIYGDSRYTRRSNK